MILLWRKSTEIVFYCWEAVTSASSISLEFYVTFHWKILWRTCITYLCLKCAINSSASWGKLFSIERYNVQVYFYEKNCVSYWKCVLRQCLTHWGREREHICIGNLPIIGSDNGLSPGRRQAIILTNSGILLIGPSGTNFSGILIEIQTFSFKKMRLKVLSAKCRLFCLSLNVLKLKFSLSSVQARGGLCRISALFFQKTPHSLTSGPSWLGPLLVLCSCLLVIGPFFFRMVGPKRP